MHNVFFDYTVIALHFRYAKYKYIYRRTIGLKTRHLVAQLWHSGRQNVLRRFLRIINRGLIPWMKFARNTASFTNASSRYWWLQKCIKRVVGKRYFLWAKHCTKIFVLSVYRRTMDLIYPVTSLYERIFWLHPGKKIGPSLAILQHSAWKLMEFNSSLMQSIFVEN